MTARHIRPPARLAMLATAPLLLLGTTAANAFEGDPSYTYLGAGYLWNDVNYAVTQLGAEHEGVNIEGSLGLFESGRFGVHLYGEYFKGDYKTNSSVVTVVDGGEGSSPTEVEVTVPDGDGEGFMLGAGVSFGVSETTDLVARAMYADTEVDLPNELGQLVGVSGDGYVVQALVRTMVGDRTEIEAGYRYTDIDGSGNEIGSVSNSDVLLGITYSVVPQVAVRARAIVFDDETGLELGVRWYFGKLYGRDFLF